MREQQRLILKILQVLQNAYAVCISVATSICIKYDPSHYLQKLKKLQNFWILISAVNILFFLLPNTTLISIFLILWNYHRNQWKVSYFEGGQFVLSNINDSSVNQFLLSNKHLWHQNLTHTVHFLPYMLWLPYSDASANSLT